MPFIDLNCDLGEGAGQDAELMSLVSSANVACGAHAGDAETMRASVVLARWHRTALGAHPGFEDRANFGRQEWRLADEDICRLVCRQIEVLKEIAAPLGATLRHVKPHGALYNLAAREVAVAEAVVAGVRAADATLIVFALAGSALLRSAEAAGLKTASEVFADRTYQADGTLTPRGRPDALIEEERTAVAQVLRMVRTGEVIATDGARVPVRADTVCLHGDEAKAVAFARRLRAELEVEGITVRPPTG